MAVSKCPCLGKEWAPAHQFVDRKRPNCHTCSKPSDCEHLKPVGLFAPDPAR